MIEAALLRCIQQKRPDGRPEDGKLLSLELNMGPASWQAIAKFSGVAKWNVAVGLDPVECIRRVLESPETDDFSDLLA